MLCVNSPSITASTAPPAQNSIRICTQKHGEHKTGCTFQKHNRTVLQKQPHFIAQDRLTETGVLSLFLNVQLGTMAALCFCCRRICLSYCHKHTYMNQQALVKKKKNRPTAHIQKAIVHSTHSKKKKKSRTLIQFSAEFHKHSRITLTDKSRFTVQQHPNKNILATLLTLQIHSLHSAVISQQGHEWSMKLPSLEGFSRSTVT